MRASVGDAATPVSARSGRVRTKDRRHRLSRCLATERSPTGEQFLYSTAPKANRSARASTGCPRTCSGSHVAHAADDGPVASDGPNRFSRGVERVRRRARGARQPEVQDLYATVPQDEDVFRLEVAMNQLFLAGRSQTARNLDGPLDRLSHGEWVPRADERGGCPPSRSSVTAYSRPPSEPVSKIANTLG